MVRRYRITPDGEKPVWPNRRTLERMGQRAGVEAAHRGFDCPLRWGNPVYDNAVKDAYDRTKAKNNQVHDAV